MQKHAYMIIAHNEFDLLEILVRLLDDPRNDIYIHIDAKVKDFDFKVLSGADTVFQVAVYAAPNIRDLGRFFVSKYRVAPSTNSSGRGGSGAALCLLPFDLRRGSAY